MQQTTLSESTLEEFYGEVILPQFGITKKHIFWQEHRSIGPDSDLHVFLCDDEQMVLVFDDYPTTTIESITREHPDKHVLQMLLGAKSGVTHDGATQPSDDLRTLRFGPLELPFAYVHNVTGYFQLFRLNTPAIEVDLMRLNAKRRRIKGRSAIYASLLDIGFELIALGRKGASWDGLTHIAASAQWLAEAHEFYDLSTFFFDLAESEELSNKSFDSFKADLKQLASDARINPGVSGHDKRLLDAHTLPIHKKMTENPSKSPEYFIELAHELDRLVTKEGLSVLAAGHELSFALDRPQITADKKLQPVVLKAFGLELPHTLRTNDPDEQWSLFLEELK